MKFHLLLTQFWLKMEKVAEILAKGNNSSTTDDLMKVYMHHTTMVIFSPYKFNEIASIAYLVLAEDGKNALTFRLSKDNNSSITKASHA